MLPAMHAIVHELTIAAPPEAVYDAITTAAGLASWWTTDVQAEPTVDSEATFGFEGHTVVFTMRIDLLESPELVHWTCTAGPDEWVGTQIAFRVEGVDTNDDGQPDGGTLVRFWHGDWEYDDGLLPASSFRWAMYLDSLRRALETGTGAPNTA
jgi:uncharacterized protein YndB with AHSA1/START domain